MESDPSFMEMDDKEAREAPAADEDARTREEEPHPEPESPDETNKQAPETGGGTTPDSGQGPATGDSTGKEASGNP